MARWKPFFFYLFICSLVETGCTSDSTSSPYDELLSKPPYAVLTDSIHQNGADPDLYYRRGMLLTKNNNNLPALADFEKAWGINQREIYAINISNLLLDSRVDTVISFLHHAISIFPESIPLSLNLIQALADQQKTDEAIATCDTVLVLHPGQVGVLMMKADLLDQKNDSLASLQTLQRAYLFAPANEELCYALAFKYAQAKNPKLLVLCDSLLKNDSISRKAEPFYFKGVYYSNLDDKSGAIENFDRAIANDYTFLDAYMDKGRVLFEEKKYGAATSVFQLTLKISPAFADAYFWLGKCEEMQGQKEDARLNYQRAYGLDKSLSDAKEAADRLK